MVCGGDLMSVRPKMWLEEAVDVTVSRPRRGRTGRVVLTALENLEDNMVAVATRQ